MVLTMVPEHLRDMENKEPISLEARRAAITGARALVAEERWQAMLGMLIDTEVVSAAEVAAMCERLAERLEGHASGELVSAYVPHAPELLEAAGRSRNVARLCREVRCG